MGLTVHYELRSRAATSRAALALVKKLRRRALSLPFRRVGPIVSFAPDASRVLPTEPPWFCELLELLAFERSGRTVFPSRAHAFQVHPGLGAEPASFGLLRYPNNIRLPGGRTAATRRSGWCWQDSCKTQYASDPRYGGFENFHNCHLSLISLLDAAGEIGLRPRVKDEGQYAVHRDVAQLRREVAEWNELLAAIVGTLKTRCPENTPRPSRRTRILNISKPAGDGIDLDGQLYSIVGPSANMNHD